MIMSVSEFNQVCALVADGMGKTLTKGDKDQLSILLDAFGIYKERNDRYQDLWKQYGARDNAFHLRSKALRVTQETDKSARDDDGFDYEHDMDDAYDAINYAAFTIRCVDEGYLGSVGGV